MDTRNLTLALPDGLIRQAKLLAAERGTSISAIVRELLQDEVTRGRRVAGARTRHLAALRRPADMGTSGRACWSREDLHER